MGSSVSDLQDAIKKVLTSKLGINIDSLTGYKKIEEGKYEVKFKNKNGQVEVKTIQNIIILPDTSLMPHINSLAKLEKDMYENKEAYFVKNTNIVDVAQSRQATSYEGIIDKMRGHLQKFRPKDLGALRYAAMICHWEDTGTTEKEIEPMRKHLSAIYPIGSIRGHTIYNWLRCGEVFDQEVFPKLDLCLAITDNDIDFEKSFFELFWDSRLAFHPSKIFVGRSMFETELRWEIRRRFDEDTTVKEINVYARRKKITLADTSIKGLLKSRKDLICPDEEIKEYPLGDSPARTYVIRRKLL